MDDAVFFVRTCENGITKRSIFTVNIYDILTYSCVKTWRCVAKSI